MKYLQLPFKLTTFLSGFLTILCLLAGMVTYLAAKETIAIIAHIIVWLIFAAGIIAIVLLFLDRIQWFRLRRTEFHKNQCLAKNEARQANIESERKYVRMVAEAKLLGATIKQVERGMIHPAALGDGKFSSFPTQVINQIEAQGVPPTQQVTLPPKVDLSQLIPTGPTLNALALGMEATDTGLRALTAPLASLVHVGVGGSSGWGKSVFLQCLAIQIALAPEMAQMALIDIEGQTFSPFSALGGDRLRYPLADNEADITAILDDLRSEWEHRRQLYQRYPTAATLDAYNTLAEAPLPPVVMLFDEINMVSDDKDIMGRLTRLGQGTRKYGIFCILGGQDWNAASIPTKLRNNFSTRIQLKAMSKIQSRVMLENSSAAAITDPGRAYAILPGRGVSEIQTPFIELNDIARALATIPNAAPPTSAPTERERIESQVIACYRESGSYGAAYKRLYELENKKPYNGAKLGNFHRNKVKAILDRNHVQHPVKPENRGELGE